MTRRITVISRTTKGKNDRIELAATEKAKVWTSVRIRYFTVERTMPCERRGAGSAVRWRTASGLGSVGMGGVATATIHRTRGLRSARGIDVNRSSAASYRLISLSSLKLSGNGGW